MSWEDVIQLASKISKLSQDKGINAVGLYYDDSLFGLAEDIASAKSTQFVDAKGNVTFKTQSWEYIINLVMEGAKNNSIHTRDDFSESEDPFALGPFSAGKVAMTVEYSYLLDDLQEANFKWDIVTLPVDPMYHGSTKALQPNALFGINSKAKNIKESWEFIEYLNSEEFARTLQMSGRLTGLLSREEYNNQKLDINLHAFYSIPPLDEPSISLKNLSDIYKLANQELLDAKKSNISTAEILSSLQKNIESFIQLNSR